jgi:hypothetical protein
MNIAVDERAIAVPIFFVNEDPYTTQAGAELLLGHWANSPQRAWTAVERGDGCSPEYVVVTTTGDHGRVEIHTFEETDNDLYSLTALESALGGTLTWGRALGEPDLDVQDRVLTAMRQRAEGVGLPTSWEALETLVLLSMGDAL